MRLAERTVTDLSGKLILARTSKSEALRDFRIEKESLEVRISEQKALIEKLQQRLHQSPPELLAAHKQARIYRSYIPLHKIRSKP